MPEGAKSRERSETSCIIKFNISHECTTSTSNIHFISQYTSNFFYNIKKVLQNLTFVCAILVQYTISIRGGGGGGEDFIDSLAQPNMIIKFTCVCGDM